VFLKALADYQGEVRTVAALRLVILTAVRTHELRFARWEEFEIAGKESVWRVPVERMKMRRPHIVPLSPQAIRVLADLRTHVGISSYLFPAPGKLGVISENAMIYAMYRMGYHSRATVHGFRALFSTVLNESKKFSSDAIEMQLAHVPGGVRGIYNAAQYLGERQRMMRWWGNYIERSG
jgi:integrase